MLQDHRSRLSFMGYEQAPLRTRLAIIDDTTVFNDVCCMIRDLKCSANVHCCSVWFHSRLGVHLGVGFALPLLMQFRLGLGVWSRRVVDLLGVAVRVWAVREEAERH